jgi:hypothetical protein
MSDMEFDHSQQNDFSAQAPTSKLQVPKNYR